MALVEENTPDLLHLLEEFIGKAMGASANTPPTLRGPAGDDIELYISDEDSPTQEADTAVGRTGEFPTLKVGFLSGSPATSKDEGPNQETTENQVDTITFNDGVDVYQVVERDIVSVNSLEATVGGSAQTLVEGTDYEVHSTADYTTDDAIKFLDGGTKPDDGTTFDVDYEHRKTFRTARMRWNLTFRLVLRVPRLASGEQGAGQDYPLPNRLGLALQDALVRKLNSLQGSNLWPTAAQDPNSTNPAPEEGSYVLHETQAISRLPVAQDGSLYEAVTDVRASRLGLEPGDIVRVAGKHLVTPTPLSIG